MAATTTAVVSAVDVRLPSVSYKQSKWSDTFTSFSLDDKVQEKYKEAIEALKEEAMSMLKSHGNTTNDKLVLIETLERLGVSYHFEEEIENQLRQIFISSHNQNSDDDDLFITALRFRLLRQYRHHASSKVFDKFKGEDDKFKETLTSDAKGLLSLYEAAHLSIRGEEILDEALAFTTHHLKLMVNEKLLESPLLDQVKRALELPLHRGLPRVETRHFISSYEKHESRNELLLKLAKLDFNYLQNIYKDELSQLFRWWNELDVMPKLEYARDRVVESYLWAIGFGFEPQYSYGRVSFTKYCQLLTLANDLYDNYATIDEAECFTDALEKWNMDKINQIPEHMQIICRCNLSMYDDYEREAAKQEKMFVVPKLKESMIQICRTYNKRLKWFMGEELPAFEDYIAKSVITSCLYVFCLSTIPGMKSVSSKETIDWLTSDFDQPPKIVVASAMVSRYLDDLGSYQRERKEGQMLSGMDIYMKNHGSSLQETADKFIELIEDEWKNLNAEWINSTKSTSSSIVPKDIMKQFLNYARAAEVHYRTRLDGFADPDVVAPQVFAVFVDPIIITDN